MTEIDFEKIRLDALQDATKNIQDNVYGDLLRSIADLSPDVTKKMLMEYDRKLHECD